LKTLEHAGRGGMEKIVSAKHAITDLIARGRKSQARAARTDFNYFRVLR
jgi:hypothetical protein